MNKEEDLYKDLFEVEVFRRKQYQEENKQLKKKLNKIKNSFDDGNLNNYYHGMSYEFEINEFKNDVLEILKGEENE